MHRLLLSLLFWTTLAIGADTPRQLMWKDLAPRATVDNPFAHLATRKLEKAGVDVEALLAKRREMAEQKKAGAHAPNAALDGAIVRLPGYVLPLEITGKQVTEFLLVPWVGACIHTPPPPANQIVHVKAETPFELTGGMFMPVWVTGRMSTGTLKKALTMIDGSSDIDVGYALRASRVEPYRE